MKERISLINKYINKFYEPDIIKTNKTSLIN